MELELTIEQRGQIELIAMYAGKSPAEVLVEAAEYLVDRAAGVTPTPQEFGAPPILSREQMEQRFAQMLRNSDRRRR